MGLMGNSVYFNYTVVQSDDGGKTVQRFSHGDNYSADYLPDLVANRTLHMIQQLGDGSPNRPFLIVAAWPTPHDPFTPAPHFEHAFDGFRADRTPNWNASKEHNMHKHWTVRHMAPIDSQAEQWIDHVYQSRLESLLTIDDHIASFVDELERIGQLNNTYIVYTSDNGFQLGQHRIQSDKRHLYEHDIRVPFIVRGPGVAENSVNNQPILNIDIAPTIHHIATGTLEPPETMDGHSFLPLIKDESSREWRTDFLVSYHGEGGSPCGFLGGCPPPQPDEFHGKGTAGDCWNNTYHCVRTLKQGKNTMYCRFQDDESFVEYYDLTLDPWQLENCVGELSLEERLRFEARPAHLRSCQGLSCRTETMGNIVELL